MADRKIAFLASLMATALSFPGAIHGQECATNLSPRCAPYLAKLEPNACLKPGSVFMLRERWEPARGTITYRDQKEVEFFYVIDTKELKTPYGALFVGVDRVLAYNVSSKVVLSQNQSFGVNESEFKQNYSRGLTGYKTRPMRRWGYLPAIGNVFSRLPPQIPSRFDFPQAVADQSHAPHARFHQFETGSITCVPFSAGLSSDINAIVGHVVELASGREPVVFQVKIEQ